MNRLQIFIREPFNSLSHWVGSIGSIIGLFFLLWYTNYENWIAVLSFWIFGLSLFLLYTSSAVYHMINASEKVLILFQKVDHMMIYVLIAGTYTPLCLLVLDQPTGWYVFFAVWVVAALGIIKKIFWIHAPRWISTAFYLAMGWAGIFLFPSIYQNLAFGAIIWIAAGGLLYTIGAIIYGIQKPNPLPDVFGFHEIWHLFVLGASFCHYWTVYYYITPIT